jgi:hypothetical protein
MTPEPKPSLADLARKTGIPAYVLRKRWDAGDRGERLLRPSRRLPRPAQTDPRGTFI